MPPPAVRLSHLGLFARDPVGLGAFYEKRLGFTITDKGDLPGIGSLVFLSRDPTEHHQIVLVSGSEPTTRGGVNTVNQISLRVESLAALRALQTQMKAATHSTEMVAVSHGNSVSLYFVDPEGNRIECYIDSPWYCAQPQRRILDLQQSDAEIWRVVEEHARSQPKFKPREEWVAEMRQKMQLSSNL